MSALWTLGYTCDPSQRVNVILDLPPGIVEVSPPEFAFIGSFALVELGYPDFSGNEQAGVSMQPLQYPLRVKVTDENGDPVQDNQIGFVVTSGGGTVTPTATTNADGIAEAIWTLGDHGQPQEVMATNIDDCNYSIGAPLLYTANVPCPLTVTDIDDNVYDVVNLGGKCWTQQNLRVTHLRNGVPLRDTLTIEEWEYEWNTIMFLGSWYAEYVPPTCMPSPMGANAGYLYTGSEPIQLCPEGWHIPSENEWRDLFAFAEYVDLDWLAPDGFRLVESGFLDLELFQDPVLSTSGYSPFWSSTAFPVPELFSYWTGQIDLLNVGSTTIERGALDGLPCRCVRD